MNKFLLLFVALVLVVQQIASAPLRKRLVKVGVELDSTTKQDNTYKLEFTNLSYKLVCQVKFRIELPETASMDKYWNMKPIDGTENEFTLPLEHMYPGRSFADARIKLNGVGKPAITVMDTVDVLSTKPCPTVPMFQ